MNFDFPLPTCLYSIEKKRMKSATYRFTFPLVSDVDVEEFTVFNEELKITCKLFLIFIRFMGTFLLLVLKLNSNYMVFTYALAEV